MRCALALSRAQFGLAAPLVQVEAHVGPGLPNLNLVGLPAPVVRESRERVRAAILSSGFEYPNGRITLNLAPAELSKRGGRFDLPIALAILAGAGQIQPLQQRFECYGELGLDGELKPVAGLLLAALHAQLAEHALIVPSANLAEVRLSGHPSVHGAGNLLQAAEIFSGCAPRLSARALARRRRLTLPGPGSTASDVTSAAQALLSPPELLLSQVIGQAHVKRALIVAAAGGHSLLMIGPPGSGKSMLAARLPALLPPMSSMEALEVAGIASTAGIKLEARGWLRRPFRCPHHSSSTQAIVGGGPQIRPGEITLAHHGVLFLDELPEFDRRVLESLREPLETGAVTIARAAARLELPARFQLVAAMNPCPCGYFGDATGRCHCSRVRVERYRQRISGPLLDRIDIRVEVPRVAGAEFALPLAGDATLAAAPASAAVPGVPAGPDANQLVERAQHWRLQRSGCLAARLDSTALQGCCPMSRSAWELLTQRAEELALSGRGLHRVLAVARTVADLDGSENIEVPHIVEAVQLRRPIEQA
jgi:magnesium chelatase family protein